MWLTILGMVIGLLILVILLFLYIYYVIKTTKKKNRTKLIGLKAEKIINHDLHIWAKKNNSIFIKTNLFIYNKNKIFEIDGILLTPYTIIIIEIKSINGEIIGDGNSDKWIKKLNKNTQHIIMNPIKQNDTHIKHIQNILQKKVPMVSLIIFSNRVDALHITNIPEYALVVRHSTLYQKLHKIKQILTPSLSEKDLIDIKKKILSYKVKNKLDKNLHGRITGRIK